MNSHVHPVTGRPIAVRLAPGARPAVLVVDLTRGFTDPACAMGADLGDEVAATVRLLEAARRSVPVIFTAVAFSPGGEDDGLWSRKLPGLAELRHGSAWVELDPRLQRRPTEPVVVKRGASALWGTDLVRLLVERRVDTVVLCGASTSGCVRATAVDLMQHGFVTLVPRECVGDRDRAQHEASLIDIDAKYGNVVSLAEALAYVDDATSARGRTGSAKTGAT